MRYLFVFAVAAGCTCFTPVAELDGGSGGGSAGGGSAGGGGAAGGSAGGTVAMTDGGCSQVSHCSGTRPNVSFCGVAGGLGWSCIDGRCLWECNGGRVCDVTRSVDGGCLDCGTTSCRGTFCGNTTRTADVESSTCSVWPGTTIPFERVTVTGNLCRYQSYQAAGVQQLGLIEQLNDGDFLADFPTFGGTCTGVNLPTGLERWLFNCPDCQFVLRF